MDVKEAAPTAKKYLISLFDDEEIVNIGLEEAVFEEMSNWWRITIKRILIKNLSFKVK